MSKCRVRRTTETDLQLYIEPSKRHRAHWLVECYWCEPNGPVWLWQIRGINPRVLAHAEDHATALEFAEAHATLHHDRTCPTCQHMPEEDVSREDTEALVWARKARL